MFGSGKKSINNEKVDTLIGQGTMFEGTVTADGTVRLDGKVQGGLNINGNLIIGEEGAVKGNVKTENAFIAGIIEGNVIATSQLHITHTAKLIGDITVKNVIIDEGAIFIGNCKIITDNT
ncbi:MAG: polymer-forming cytoskeletal protein [Clostridiaceae bacterium]|nr:polymer-forming cytoskeletal protein [Clostridiaceae bacterium]